MGIQMTFENNDLRGRSSFKRDVAPDPRSTVLHLGMARCWLAERRVRVEPETFG
jgi:hypothetical protein